MWYFSWILGLGLACAFGILNAMWYEVQATDEAHRRKDADASEH
jgi:cyd operon protein YbgT